MYKLLSKKHALILIMQRIRNFTGAHTVHSDKCYHVNKFYK